MPTASDKKIIFLIGATGAQGQPVIKALLEDAKDGTPSPYAIRALTRDPEHRRAKELEHQGVKLILELEFRDIESHGMYLFTTGRLDGLCPGLLWCRASVAR
ncbi:hypothetical protein BS47DRAFT_1414762 [Hydnum rufescens UP504]|uniref:NmrA-like domain-containing protein n=1 Tax=Hydnum rufescens UP504 TaxID=1448309 RepID=A0A9P6B792_9AGAM|nr:hypothetical protein BS47DRAFT_1414762 [Hydnum rufescens UP504]